MRVRVNSFQSTGADVHALTTISFGLVPASDAVAKCLPDATGAVTVLHKEDTLGVDTLHLDARGLPADTDFAVFLTSADAFATPSFGTVEYIGDFTTNAAGIGSLKVDAIIAEAFVNTLRPPGFLVRRSGTGSSRLQLDGRYPLRRRWARRTGGDVLGREHRA
jgi:hypothetical protein